MENLKNYLKKYLVFIISIIALILTYVWNVDFGKSASNTIVKSLKEMMLILPPVFIMLGLLDIWVAKETMVKYMGNDSGIIGVLLAFFLGAAAAGPLYVVFPIAATFMKKGVKFTNILILIGAWSTMKIPMFLFEITSLGPKFAFTRLAINIPIVLIMAYGINKMFTKEEIKNIYKSAIANIK